RGSQRFPTTSFAARSERPPVSCAARSRARGAGAPSTAAPGVGALVAAARFARAASATRTGRRTGARPAREERTPRGRNEACAVACPLSRAQGLLPGGVSLPRPGGRARRGDPVRLRGAWLARPPGAVRVPSARRVVRGRSRREARETGGRRDRARRAAGRAGRGDLRARARGYKT